MLLHQCEELHRGHLEGDGDVLIGVHHDHIIFLLHCVQEGPAVIGGHGHVLRQVEILPGKGRDLLIDLHALDFHVPIVLPALCGIGAGAHAQNQYPTVLRLLSLHHQRRGHGVIIVHAREPLLLHIDGLDSEEHVGGKYDAPVIFLHLEIIVDRLPLVGQVALPEGEAVGMPQRAAQQIAQKGSRSPSHPPDALLSRRAGKVGNGQSQQYPCKDQEGDGGSHGRDGDEGGHKGAYDAADGVEGPQVPHHFPALLQIAHRIFRQRGRHRAQQKQREHKDCHTGRKGRHDEEICAHGEYQQRRNPQYDVLPHHGDGRNPHCRYQHPCVELPRVRILVRAAPAVDVPQRHGDHDGADDDRPHNLGGTEIGGKQPAGPQLHRHHGHAGEKLRQVQKYPILQYFRCIGHAHLLFSLGLLFLPAPLPLMIRNLPRNPGHWIRHASIFHGHILLRSSLPHIPDGKSFLWQTLMTPHINHSRASFTAAPHPPASAPVPRSPDLSPEPWQCPGRSGS